MAEVQVQSWKYPAGFDKVIDGEHARVRDIQQIGFFRREEQAPYRYGFIKVKDGGYYFVDGRFEVLLTSSRQVQVGR